MLSEEKKALQWKLGEFRLNYELGDLRIGLVMLHGIECTSHFLDFSIEQVLSEPLAYLAHFGVQSAQVMSCPVSTQSKIVSFVRSVIVYRMAAYNHYYVDVKTSFSEYQEKFKGKTRATLKKKVNKLLQDPERKGVFEKFVSPCEIDRFLELAAIVSVKTYQHRLFGRGIPETKAFREEALEKAAHGLVRGYVLSLDGEPIAYTYVPQVQKGVFLYDYNGYDPKYSKWSPGSVMQYRIIEDLCSDPEARIYDLCTGEDEAKMLFSTHSIFCADLLILKKSFENICLVLSHRTVTVCSALIGRVLSLLNLKMCLKRIIRRNACMTA